MSGIATPTSSHNDALADEHDDCTPRGGDDGPRQPSDIIARLAKKLAKYYALEPAREDTPCFTQGSRRQLLNYWKRCVVYASSPLPAAQWLRIESSLRDFGKDMFQFKEEFWSLANYADPSNIYTGANICWRPALVSTARGCKRVNGAVISQFSTAPTLRRRGHGARFLMRLAEEMDRRKGEERIEFSVVFGGPDTNFLKQRG